LHQPLQAGIIGLLTTMIAKALQPEAQVTGVARYPYQARMAEKLGANHALEEDSLYAKVANIVTGKFLQLR